MLLLYLLKIFYCYRLGNIPDEVPKKTKRTQQRVRKNIDDLVAPTQVSEVYIDSEQS